MTTLLRLSYGSALLVRPATVLRAAHVKADPHACTYARILGVRHLLQGVLLLRAAARAHLIGAAVDAAHAVTSLAWAIASKEHRRGLLLDAAAAGAFAAAGSATPAKSPR